MENIIHIPIDHPNSKESDLSGSKIPITTIEIIVRDTRDRSIVYRDVVVIQGHNIPSEKIEEIRETQRAKYKAERNKGLPYEQLRRVFGQ